MNYHGIEIEFSSEEIEIESKVLDKLKLDYFDLTDLDNGNTVYYISGKNLSEYLINTFNY